MARKGQRNLKYSHPWESAELNSWTYTEWYNYLRNLSLNVFEWDGLPETCDARFLELTEFERGYCLFFNDPALDKYLTLPCSLGGRWDVYNLPIRRRAFASNGYNCTLDKFNSVIIFNNLSHTPSQFYVRMYANRLAEIDRTIDTNIKAQKTPILIKCTEEQRLSMKNFFEKYDGNEPYIFLNSKQNFGEIEVINLNAPYVANDLFQLKQFYLNEFLTILGYENSNQDKKAQMTSNEIGANYGQVEASRNSGLTSRKMACEEINRLFGLDVTVNVSSKLHTLVNEPFLNPDSYVQDEPSMIIPTEGGIDE